MRLSRPIYIIALGFTLLVCMYFLFALPPHSDSATGQRSSSVRAQSKNKKCSCCATLKKFEKKFAARQAAKKKAENIQK